MEQGSFDIQSNIELTALALNDLLVQKNANIRFLPKGAFVYIEDKHLEKHLSKYEINKEEFDENVRKIIKLVRNYIDDEYQGTEIDLISKYLPIEKWKSEFIFATMAIADTIDEVSFQPLIKPLEDGGSIKTGILKITLNQNDNSNKEVKIEFNAEKLDDFIVKLKEYQEKL